MDDDNFDLVFSPLTQTLTRDGHTIDVEIYEDGEGGWLLEVVDAYGTSTVWDESFATDSAALNEVLKTIEEEGIAVLAGSPPELQLPLGDVDALSVEELDELDDLLAGIAGGLAMDVATLDGFLTCLAIGPCQVSPADWLPWVFDMDEGKAAAPTDDMVQASVLIGLLMRHYNALIDTFESDEAVIVPVFWRGTQWDVAQWCDGFVLGFIFDEAAWRMVFDAHPGWIEPFLRLAADGEFAEGDSEADAQRWSKKIAPTLLHIDAYWKDRREFGPSYPGGMAGMTLVRDSPKVGRNDPCPCGSGKKYKKCCVQ
ncbi:MAG: UPF0149 family protein [Pseudomonadota bacterium]